MKSREAYSPGPADLAHVEKDGENWTLVLVKELRHPPEKVWAALTDPAQLREWAPFDADRNLDAVGPVKLTTVGSPSPHVVDSAVSRAEAPATGAGRPGHGGVLEFQWGGGDTRWELEALGHGTRLTLWAQIDRKWIAMGAAGWHICLDVLDSTLSEEPIGRMVGIETMKFEGWQRLKKEYAEQFGVSD